MLSASLAALDLAVPYCRTLSKWTDSQFAALKSVAVVEMVRCLLVEAVGSIAEECRGKGCDDSSVNAKASTKVFRRVGAFHHISCLKKYEHVCTPTTPYPTIFRRSGTAQ